MTPKPFWASKTLGFILLALLCVLAQFIQGTTWLPPGVEALIGLAAGAVLRFLTSSGVKIPGLGSGEEPGAS